MGQDSNTVPSTTASAATDAKGVSDELIQKILPFVVPFNPNAGMPGMGGMIQNRPAPMMPTPIMPKQREMTQPSGLVNATTRAGQQRNDTLSLINSVGNIVKGAMNKKNEKEQRDLMSDLALIQAAASNPSDPHNQNILQQIADDPKRVKRLQKAIGYNPLSGDKMPPEAQTLTKFAAQSQVKNQQQGGGGGNTTPQSGNQTGGTPGVPQGSPMANLLSRMPNMQQLAPMVQLQGELIKSGILPKADTQLNALSDLTKTLIQSESRMKEAKEKALATHNVAAMHYLMNLDRIAGRIREAELKTKAARDIEDRRAKVQERGQDLRHQDAQGRARSEEVARYRTYLSNQNEAIKRSEEQFAALSKDDKVGDKGKKLQLQIQQQQIMRDIVQEQLKNKLNDDGSQSTPESNSPAQDLLKDDNSDQSQQMDMGDIIGEIWGASQP